MIKEIPRWKNSKSLVAKRLQVKCETVERKRKGTNEVEPQDSGKPWTGMASVDRDPEYFGDGAFVTRCDRCPKPTPSRKLKRLIS